MTDFKGRLFHTEYVKEASGCIGSLLAGGRDKYKTGQSEEQAEAGIANFYSHVNFSPAQPVPPPVGRSSGLQAIDARCVKVTVH